MHGIEVLHDPAINKATAYTEAERQALGLIGLVPDETESEDLQFRRVLQQLGEKTTDLDRYIYLSGLLDNNETLFYRLLMSDPARFLPIVYDPTVGEACLKYGHIYRRPRGMYLSIARKGHVKEVLRNWPVADVRVICVTDGGRILGFCDLGFNGMPISSASYNCTQQRPLYRLSSLLPIYLDAGTNNESLLHDPLPGITQAAPDCQGVVRLRGRIRGRGAGSVSPLLHTFRGLDGHRRHQPARALSRHCLLLQRRHSGHCKRYACRIAERPQSH
jgi:malate dehydrogenase (oxaloacetate-decarboxylating)(NADP+)